MNNNVVSVIIPTYNGARWLRDSLTSVLHQAYCPIEIIIVDDGSTDSTLNVLQEFEPYIHLVRCNRGGIGAARNCGVTKASGEYLAFLDQDDLWRDEKLDIQIGYISHHFDIHVLYSDALEFDEASICNNCYIDRFPIISSTDSLVLAMIRFAIPLMSTVVIRTSFLLNNRLSFIESVSGVDDLGLLLEAAAYDGNITCQNEKLVLRRLHSDNLSKNHFHRFIKRVILYSELLVRLDTFQPKYRFFLMEGLRDAHFRVGEWFWGQEKFQQAREHFRAAFYLNHLGIKAFLLFAITLLPLPFARCLFAFKRLLLQRLISGW